MNPFIVLSAVVAGCTAARLIAGCDSARQTEVGSETEKLSLIIPI
jgi:hypothetical protein